MVWKYFDPKFEYEKMFEDSAWPWSGHKYFGYDLVANIKPKRIVELGTHYGTSFWSFSQAVKDQNVETELNAVDSWKGEEHSGLYGEEVFDKVKEIKNEFYSGLKINLIRKTFDDVVSDFRDGSIDILHIDGLHTYEAVKHDFDKWLPKVSKNGIVLFHDINVREDDFGVYRLWEELKKKYTTIEFFQSYGLGVVCLDKIYGKEMKSREQEWQMHYSYIYEANKSQAVQFKDNQIRLENNEVQSLGKEIAITRLQLDSTRIERDLIKTELGSAESELGSVRIQMESIKTDLDRKVSELKEIYSCRGWKIIVVIRKVLKPYFVLKRDGPSLFVRKVFGYIYRGINFNQKKLIVKRVLNENYQPMFLGELGKEQITVIVHLYYTDMWPEIAKRLRNLPYRYTLIVSLTKDHHSQSVIDEIKSFMPEAKVVEFENKGMDILPFLKCLKYVPQTTKYLLKIHTKKSPHSPTIGNKWFVSLMDHVLPDRKTVDLILHNIEYTDIGMVGGSDLFDIFRTFTGDEMYEPQIELIYHYFNDKHSSYNWISGTIFWVRYELIKKLADEEFISFIEEHQPSGYAQLGTIVHGMERYFGKLVYDAGKRISLCPEKIDTKDIIVFNGQSHFLHPDREYMVVISHDATKTGAPILALNIAKTITADFRKKVIIILMRGGPLEDEFKKCGVVINLSHLRVAMMDEKDQETIDSLFNSLARAGVHKCICNTVVSGVLMPFLSKHGFSCVNLVHELPETIKLENYVDATEKVLSYATKLVFSSKFVMGEFERSFKSFRKEIFVRPQGIYLKNAFDGRREEAREMLRVKLGLEKSARIILGCGSACLKKGVDLFFEVASQIYTENKGLECHFVWLGEWDLNLRSDLIKTAKEKGYYNKLILIDFEDDPSLFFAGADAFLLTSRQDPFPSVVLNAMDCGVPVIAFDKSGGSSEILARQQGVVVPYLDVLSMRRELIKLLIDDQFYMNISENSRKAVKDRFIFKDYIKFLLDQLQDNDK